MRINYKLSLALIFVLIFSSLLMGATKESELRAKTEENLRIKTKAYNSMLEYLRRSPDAEKYERIDDLYFKLGELSADLYPTDSELSLTYFRKVLELNPKYPNRDVVLYNIGYLQSDLQKKLRDTQRQKRVEDIITEGRYEPILKWGESERLTLDNTKEAIDAYTKLVLEESNSKYFEEALFRLGILYYDIGMDDDYEPVFYYNKAKDIFDVLAKEDTDGFRHLSLYQRAWSYFSINDFENAIDDFCNVLSIMNENSKFKVFFEEDAIENIAYSLVRMDGSDYSVASHSVIYAKQRLPQMLHNERYLTTILYRVIEIKKQLNAPFHAVDYYEALLELFPNNLKNPSIVEEIVNLYTTYGYLFASDNELRDKVVDLKQRLADSFKGNSGWYETNKEIKGFDEQLQIVRDSYIFLEPMIWNRFVINRNLDNYSQYLSHLEDFKAYPEFNDKEGVEWYVSKLKNLVDASLVFAEEKNEPIYCLQAYGFVTEFNTTYPSNDDFYKYEKARYDVVETLYERLKDVVEDEAYVDEENNIEINKDSLIQLYLKAAGEFLDTFENLVRGVEIDESEKPTYHNNVTPEEIVGALYRRSQIFLADKNYEEAEKDLLAMLDFEIDEMLRRDIFIYLAQINERNSNFTLAENYYRKAAEYAVDVDDAENIRNHYRRQMQSTANALSQDESYSEAAEEYLRLAAEFKEIDNDRAVGLQNQAVDVYIKAGEYQKAIDLLVDMSSLREEIDAVYFLYSKAWALADTSLTDDRQTLALKNEFVDKYPSTNQAFIIRYGIINELSSNEDTKYEAGDLLLVLHNEVREGKIDNDDFKVEDIYFNALDIYHEHPDRDKVMNMMLEFERLYPEDLRSNDLLIVVALYYDEEGRDEEFEELAKYLHKKDPDSNLYESIARKKIVKIYEEATEYFVEKEFDKMFAKIDEFENLDAEYRKNNLNLPLEDFYYDFDAYKNAYDDMNRYHEYIADMKKLYEDTMSNVVEAEHGTIFRSNIYTTWNSHLVGGDKRLDKFVDRSRQVESEILSLFEGEKDLVYDVIPDVIKAEGVYIIGRVYERFSETVEVQLNRYLSSSVEMVELKDYSDDEYQATKDYITNNYIVPYVEFFQEKAKDWYRLLLSTFGDTDFASEAKERLSELPSQIEHSSVNSDYDWVAAYGNAEAINTDNLVWHMVDDASDKVDIEQIVGIKGENSIPIWISVGIVDEEAEELPTSLLFKKQFDTSDGEVVEANLNFFSYGRSSIWLNDQLIASDLVFVQDDENTELSALTVEIDSSSINNDGVNTLVVQTELLDENEAIVLELDLISNK
ncbi:MAG: hypothetical protein WC327_04200 [Candidatus Cloacimonadia bacterium]